MKHEAYILRTPTETAYAIVIAWIGYRTGVFKLCSKLGDFKPDDVIEVNLVTLEASLYEDLIERKVV